MKSVRPWLHLFFALLITAGEAAAQNAAEATGSGMYSHLPLSDGGPGWTLDELRNAIPAGTVPMEIDPRVPISKIDNPAESMLAAFVRLESADKREHETAFRIVGATAKLTALQDATRLLSYMLFHGIGTKGDPTAAVRSALPLIRAGDLRACEFAAASSPATFKSATSPFSIEKIMKLKPRVPLRLGGMITADDDDGLRLDGAKLRIELASDLPNAKVGRHIDLWGLCVEDGVKALIAEVPDPVASFKWKVNASAVRGGTWQVHSVRVTVANSGVQPIKSVQFSVRCYINDGAVNDQTQQAEITDIPPGKTKSIDVGFEMYNYQYIDAVSVPKARVDVKHTEW